MVPFYHNLTFIFGFAIVFKNPVEGEL